MDYGDYKSKIRGIAIMLGGTYILCLKNKIYIYFITNSIHILLEGGQF